MSIWILGLFLTGLFFELFNYKSSLYITDMSPLVLALELGLVPSFCVCVIHSVSALLVGKTIFSLISGS